MQSSTPPATQDRFVTAPEDRSGTPHHPVSDDEIPCAPDYWTLEDFSDILPESIQ